MRGIISLTEKMASRGQGVSVAFELKKPPACSLAA